MSVAPLPSMPSVRCEEGKAFFEQFVEEDPTVVETLASAGDQEACAHELLSLGARTAAVTAGAGGLRDLEARVAAHLETLGSSTASSLAKAVAELSVHSRSLFASDGGEVTATLTRWRSELDRDLNQLFDPEHKRSVISAIERSVAGVLEGERQRLVALTDPDNPSSTAGRVLAQINAQSVELRSELHALSTALGAAEGRAAEHARTAIKGVEFEQTVLEAISLIASAHGDEVEHVGRSAGMKGSKKGTCLSLFRRAS